MSDGRAVGAAQSGLKAAVAVACAGLAFVYPAPVHPLTSAELAASLQRSFQLQAAAPSGAAVATGADGIAVVRFRLSSAAAKVANGFRVEYKGSVSPIDRGVGQWYAFSYLQSEDWLRWRKPVVIGQVHTAQIGSITAPPPIGIVVRDGRLAIVLHHADRPAVDIDKQDNRLLEQLSVSAGGVVPGRWTCLLVRAVWSSTPGQGELAIWRDGERVLLIRNKANAYPTSLGMYPKFGLYAYDGVDGDEMALDADLLNVFDGKLAVEQVRARARCADK